ncbi:hypothetical protein [Burkholderia ubonensis]|uniref:hypothetical protein n=1 Tax=Burkholderia ubonensis TaxID=101571 RepID=UPI00075D9817|nr:hypothetical protein [Burkholderia ubonensis]KVP17129.1 hypothetical protein WJ84_02295 [Burkholderia ubonensis]KVP39750.1 hypothetical protein WJ87_06085 [Burkholderia ubonensis]
MSTLLESPDSSAPTQDWRAWLDDLMEMQQTAEVKSAVRRAQQVLNSRRSTVKRAVRKSRDRFDLAAAY